MRPTDFQQAVVRYSTLTNAFVDELPAHTRKLAADASAVDNKEDVRLFVQRGSSGRRWAHPPYMFEKYEMDDAAKGTVFVLARPTATPAPPLPRPPFAVPGPNSCALLLLRAHTQNLAFLGAGNDPTKTADAETSSSASSVVLHKFRKSVQVRPPRSNAPCFRHTPDSLLSGVSCSCWIGILLRALRNGRLHRLAMHRVPHRVPQSLCGKGACATRRAGGPSRRPAF